MNMTRKHTHKYVLKYGDFTSILQSYQALSISVNSILEICDYVQPTDLCTTLNLGLYYKYYNNCYSFYDFVPILYSYCNLFFLTFVMLVKYIIMSISTGLYPTLDLWTADK